MRNNNNIENLTRRKGPKKDDIVWTAITRLISIESQPKKIVVVVVVVIVGAVGAVVVVVVVIPVVNPRNMPLKFA